MVIDDPLVAAPRSAATLTDGGVEFVVEVPDSELWVAECQETVFTALDKGNDGTEDGLAHRSTAINFTT